MNQLTRVVSVLCLSALMAGCAQMMAINQPAPFTPTSLQTGASRSRIAGELGSPVGVEESDSELQESYKYSDGGSKNHGASKTLRVLVYTGGDVFTLFLSQIIWIPMEKFGFAGTEHLVEVEYENKDGKWMAKTINDQVITSAPK